jgi:hypothetical protein
MLLQGARRSRKLGRPARSQGLTLVPISAQLQPCLTHNNTLHTLNTHLTRSTQPLRASPIPRKALKWS